MRALEWGVIVKDVWSWGARGSSGGILSALALQEGAGQFLSLPALHLCCASVPPPFQKPVEREEDL